MKKRKVSILIPCFNEQQSLPLLYAEIAKTIGALPRYDWEILLVDDGSRDDTLRVMERLRSADPRVCYVALSRNFGKERAMLAGFDYVTGDCMIIMDADLQDPPGLIGGMLDCWEEGYDDVYARRSCRGKESWLRKRFSLAYYGILRRTTRIDILPNVGDFRLLDRCCIDTLRRLRESERYTKGLFAWIGFRKKEIVFERGDRVAGKTSWNFFSLLDLGIEGITSFTTAPLRISTIAGIVISFVAFVLMFYFLIKTLLFGDPVAGFPTLIVVVLFLGGVQLLSIGIIGEYLGRVFNETKNRPTYIARSYNGEKISQT
jgi:glycosyltransferase involved in cell wall biosynthesis